MIKLTKKVRRKLLDIGFRNMIDMELYLYLLDRITKSSNIVKFSYRQFCNDINKTCDSYTVSERNIYRILERVVEFGLVTVQISGKGEALLEVKPLHELFCHEDEEKTGVSEEKSEEKSEDSCSDSDSSNAAEKSRVKQQQLILTKQICKSAGINYRLEKDWWEIASHGIDKLKATIDRMMIQIASGRTKIFNPCGWLKVALRDNYYLDTPKEQTESPAVLEQIFFYAQEKLLDLTGCIPTRMDRPLQLDLLNQKTNSA